MQVGCSEFFKNSKNVTRGSLNPLESCCKTSNNRLGNTSAINHIEPRLLPE